MILQFKGEVKRMSTQGKFFKGNFSIGLDIGTNSVGWAVVNDHMNLIKRKGKHLWGSRVFEDAHNAKERRSARSVRRRLLRRRVRLQKLREIFLPLINTTGDSYFFMRMQESFLQPRDRSLKNNNILFIDSHCTIVERLDDGSVATQVINNDQEYYKKYPTIYHLRKDLLERKNAKFDPRLIYLAIHHILKSRGHFVNADLEIEQGSECNVELTSYLFDLLIEDIEQISQNEGEDDTSSDILSTSLKNNKELILNKLLTKGKSKREQLSEIVAEISLPRAYADCLKEFVKMLQGIKFSIAKLLGVELESNNFALSDSDIDAKIAENGTYADFLIHAHNLYSVIEYKKIMADEKYISNIMIAKYNRYKEHLNDLKFVLRSILPAEEYRSFFRDVNSSTNKHNYARYTIGVGADGKFLEKNKFINNIKDYFVKYDSFIKNDEVLSSKVEKLLSAMSNTEEGGFLVRPRTNQNGIYPKQVHELELKEILDNQSKYYPELAEAKDKILALFNFKIDYFVGPLATRTENKNNFGWLVRNQGYEDAVIDAFNYKQAINFELTQKNFIERMTGYCTYIIGEKALPKNSIYYCWFNVFNEISNIKVSIGGAPFVFLRKLKEVKINQDTVDVVQFIINRLKENNTFKQSDLENILSKLYPGSTIAIKGFADTHNKKLISNLKPYRDFTRILHVINDSNIDDIESMIRDITIFGESKTILKKKLKKDFTYLTDSQINEIASLGYTGWGNLSQKLIYGIKSVNGTARTILEVMGTERRNFSSVYNDERFGFKNQVQDIWAEARETPEEKIKQLACSAEVKRGILQSYYIVKELNHVMGRAPKNIFIEFSRGQGKKGLRKNRQKQVKEKYDNMKTQYLDLYREFCNAEAEEKLNSESYKLDFNQEKFYLYFLQGGKCLYTGKPLDINHLDNYHVDHIVPQSIIKDDSLDNKVLVYNEANEIKGNSEVLPDSFLEFRPLWDKLKKVELMTTNKYERLCRRYLSDDVKKGFIKRQLVETSQIIKNTAVILSEIYKEQNVKVYPIHAGLNSCFRAQFEYPKGEGARAINDLHHAKDAYITAFLGSYALANYNLDNIEALHTPEFYVGENNNERIRNGYIVGSLYYKPTREWQGFDGLTNDRAIKNFNRNYYYTDCYFTKKIENSDEGLLFKATIYKNAKNAERFGEKTDSLISLGKRGTGKYLDTQYYGGYTTMQFSKYALIKCQEESRGKYVEKYKLVGVPRLATIPTSNFSFNEYLESQGLINSKIIKILPIYQMVSGPELGKLFVVGVRKRHNATQFVIPEKYKELNKFIYLIYKYLDLDTKTVDYIKWLRDKDFPIGDKNKSFEENKEILHNYIDLCLSDFIILYLSFLRNYYPKDSTLGIIQSLLPNIYQLDLSKRLYIVTKLLKITACNSDTADFSEVGGVKNAGQITKAINPETDYLIYNSVTGIYSKKTKFLKNRA